MLGTYLRSWNGKSDGIVNSTYSTLGSNSIDNTQQVISVQVYYPNSV